MKYLLRCVSCRNQYKGTEIRNRCNCGEILEVEQDFHLLKGNSIKKLFQERLRTSLFPYQSGVWRYKELLLPIKEKYIISKPEGNTNLYSVGYEESGGFGSIGKYVGIAKIYLKHEGENPTGSFKDRGMTVGISVAKMLGIKAVACASTGNTSASLSSYAAQAGLKCFVFLPQGKISISKLAQSIAYGAINIQIDGDFDEALLSVERLSKDFGLYHLNSINPFRIEGQKTIIFELLQQLNWQVPDWIILPGGNLGNTSAIGKGLLELRKLQNINKLPKIAVIQASGADPFYQSFKTGFKKRLKIEANTLATAIRIGNPVSILKAQKVIQETEGVVEQVTDQEILDAKAIVDSSGIGCEPASATTVAGLKKLIIKKIIKKSDFVVGILTGHLLKDTDTTIKYHQETLSSIKSHFGNKVIETNQKNIKKIIESWL